MSNAAEKKLVLIVGDAPANLQVVRSILKDDFKIRVATSGAKALELVKKKPQPDLILLDVTMPEMDGYEVCGIARLQVVRKCWRMASPRTLPRSNLLFHRRTAASG